MYRFAAASTREPVLFGAARPGYPDSEVDGWIKFMQQRGIQRVCCLLSEVQLQPYSGLFKAYREAFGDGIAGAESMDRVLWAPIEDFRLCDRTTLLQKILPFLVEADRTREPVVVHCSGGVGRTGHVLAAGLVALRGLSNREAIAAVHKTGRNPDEAAIASTLRGRNPMQALRNLDALLNACR